MIQDLLQTKIIGLALLGVTLIASRAMPVMANPVQAEHIEVALMTEVTSVQPGQPFWAALRLKPEPHWHTYWRNPGDSGMPPALDWHLLEGTQTGPIVWPHPQRIPVQHLVNYGYEDEVLLLTEIQPPAALEAGSTFTLTVKASWLVCKEDCIPGEAELVLMLPVMNEPPAYDMRWQEAFAATRAQLPVTPANWEARFAVTHDQVQLQVQTTGPEFANARAITFFPIDPDVVANSAPSDIERQDTQLLLRQAKSPYFQASPEIFNGVLVVETAASKQAYRISAQPGLPPAVKDGDAALVDTGLLMTLLLAGLGGLMLNLMPCVFPVLSLKALNLASNAHAARHTQRLHGLSYTLGVIGTFIAVAGVLLLLRSGGASLGWGFQLQSPWFVALLAYLLFALGLSLSGVVQFGTNLMGIGENLTKRSGHLGSFFTGVLAVIVASPCTAPFMGTAIGFALTQPAGDALLIFATLGAGMALPFLLLSLVPSIGRLLPRPGPWMETFKQLMAFPLYLTVVWLLWVLGRQTSADGMATVLGGLVLLAFVLWLWGHNLRARRSRPARALLGLSTLVVALAVIAAPLFAERAPEITPSGEQPAAAWEPYSQARFAALRAQETPVFINMTAAWCITCLANEQIALSSDVVYAELAAKGVVYLKGDWTERDSEITAMLARFGRSGVPLYVLFPGPAEAEPIVLPQLLTSTHVLEALERI